MPNITKIINVHLFSGICKLEEAVKCYELQEYLIGKSIPYILMHYGDIRQHDQNFDNLSSQPYGLDYQIYDIRKFPFLIWQELYDDYNLVNQIAFTPHEVESKLIPNLHLIV